MIYHFGENGFDLCLLFVHSRKVISPVSSAHARTHVINNPETRNRLHEERKLLDFDKTLCLISSLPRQHMNSKNVMKSTTEYAMYTKLQLIDFLLWLFDTLIETKQKSCNVDITKLETCVYIRVNLLLFAFSLLPTNDTFSWRWLALKINKNSNNKIYKKKKCNFPFAQKHKFLRSDDRPKVIKRTKLLNSKIQIIKKKKIGKIINVLGQYLYLRACNCF